MQPGEMMNQLIDRDGTDVRGRGDRAATIDRADDRSGRLPDLRERLAAGEPIDHGRVDRVACAPTRSIAGEPASGSPPRPTWPCTPRCTAAEAAFELIYGEYLIRESLGEAPKLEEFFWRFPGFRRSAQAPARPAPAPSARNRPGPRWAAADDAGRTSAGSPRSRSVPGFEIAGHPGPGWHERGVPRPPGGPQSPGRRSR